MIQSRPFGVALLFAGYDEKGPQLFHLDPSGTYVSCLAKAIGSASEGAQTSLEEQFHKVGYCWNYLLNFAHVTW